MQMIAEQGEGVLIYLRQEGRGHRAAGEAARIQLTGSGLDTVEANPALGHQADERDYTLAARILQDLDGGRSADDQQPR